MTAAPPRDLTHDFVLPTLLFAALGAMAWAVRGCSGFGGAAGCTFAGLAWGVAWWFVAREPGAGPQRPYRSGWVVLALTAGIGIAGARGWAQWSTLFVGKLQVHTADGVWVPIASWYGFAWLFVAGVAWAGLGACALAWCAEGRRLRAWQWVLRIGCGVGTGYLLVWLFDRYPQYFQPLYAEMGPEYERATKRINNNLWRLMNDNRAAMQHVGWYLGFLLFEALRGHRRNVTLIAAVGLLNGVGWAALQNWTWAEARWPGAFNWWRCWESTGGISIGIAYGVAFYLVNRPGPAGEAIPTEAVGGAFDADRLATWLLFTLLPVGLALAIAADPSLRSLAPLAPLGYFLFSVAAPSALPILLIASATGVAYFLRQRTRRDAALPPAGSQEDGNLERWVVLSTVSLGLAVNLRNGLKGFANIYVGDEELWSDRLWLVFGPLMLLMLAVFTWRLLRRSLPDERPGDVFRGAGGLMWLVLVVQNAIALLVTGPLGDGREAAFAVYYLCLFAVTAAIVRHYRRRAVQGDAPGAGFVRV